MVLLKTCRAELELPFDATELANKVRSLILARKIFISLSGHLDLFATAFLRILRSLALWSQKSSYLIRLYLFSCSPLYECDNQIFEFVRTSELSFSSITRKVFKLSQKCSPSLLLTFFFTAWGRDFGRTVLKFNLQMASSEFDKGLASSHENSVIPVIRPRQSWKRIGQLINEEISDYPISMKPIFYHCCIG